MEGMISNWLLVVSVCMGLHSPSVPSNCTEFLRIHFDVQEFTDETVKECLAVRDGWVSDPFGVEEVIVGIHKVYFYAGCWKNYRPR